MTGLPLPRRVAAAVAALLAALTGPGVTVAAAEPAAPSAMAASAVAGRVTGTESHGADTRTTDAAFVDRLVDQRVDWAAMMAADLAPGVGIELQVYDPGTAFSRLVGTAVASPPIESVLGRVPAVRLDYTLHKGAHTEAYSVLATRRRPRVMLREDMPGGLSAVLVAVGP